MDDGPDIEPILVHPAIEPSLDRPDAEPMDNLTAHQRQALWTRLRSLATDAARAVDVRDDQKEQCASSLLQSNDLWCLLEAEEASIDRADGRELAVPKSRWPAPVARSAEPSSVVWPSLLWLVALFAFSFSSICIALAYMWACECRSTGAAFRGGCCSPRGGCGFRIETAVASNCSITLASLKEAGFWNGSFAKLQEDGVPFSTMRSVGAGFPDLARAGYPIEDFKHFNASLAELNGLSIVGSPVAISTFADLRKSGYSFQDLVIAGASLEDLLAQNVTLTSLRLGGFSLSDLRIMGAEPSELLMAGFSSSDFKHGNVSVRGFRGVSMARLRDYGWSPLELREVGATTKDLMVAGADDADLKQAHCMSVKDMRAIGANLSDIFAEGFSYADMLFGGVPSKDLRRYPFVSVTTPPGDWKWNNVMKWSHIWGPAPQFPGYFPPVASLPGIWSSAISRARADPCNQEGLLQTHFVLTHIHAGFCSKMNNLVNEMLVAMYSGRPVAACANPELKNLWADNFEVSDVPVCTTCQISDHDNSGEWLWSAGFHVALEHQTPEMEFTKRFLYKKLFVPIPEHRGTADAMQKALGLVDVPYVGVHIRRKDKIFESPTFRSTEVFADNARLLCQAIACRKIFVASDSSQEKPLVEKYIARWNASIAVVEQPRMPPETYGQRGNLTRDASLALMTDILILIRATAYVGTASSNVDRFVWFQRDPGTQSVSLDDYGNWLKRSG